MAKYYSNQSTKYAKEQQRVSPYSYGRAVPRSGSQQACLCADKLTYSRKCCKGFLINQGVGQIISPYPSHPIAFSNGFSNGFY
jgi:hypothetical protein